MTEVLITRANGLRLSRKLSAGYPSRRILVGVTRSRRFDGTNLKPETCSKTRRLPPRQPRFSCGVRVHYPGAVPGRCVGQHFGRLQAFNNTFNTKIEQLVYFYILLGLTFVWHY